MPVSTPRKGRVGGSTRTSARACHAIALLQAHVVAHDLGWPHAPWPREPNDQGHGHAYIPDRLRGVIADRPPEARPFA